MTHVAPTPPTWSERILAATAYFCWCVPPLWLMPLLILRWKRKTSRFVALHAVQSVLLAFALLFLYIALVVVLSSLTMVVQTKTQGTILAYSGPALAVGMLVWGNLGMPVVPLRGRPAALPLLARWAERILDSPPGEGGGAAGGKSAGAAYTAQRPEDRLLAGAAYLSVISWGLFLIGPVVVYFWKRKSCRFVAFHALQALLLHIALLPAMAAIFFSGFITSGLIAARVPDSRDWATGASIVGALAALALPNVILWRGFAAMLGPPNAVPLVGCVARWIAGRRRPG